MLVRSILHPIHSLFSCFLLFYFIFISPLPRSLTLCVCVLLDFSFELQSQIEIVIVNVVPDRTRRFYFTLFLCTFLILFYFFYVWFVFLFSSEILLVPIEVCECVFCALCHHSSLLLCPFGLLVPCCFSHSSTFYRFTSYLFHFIRFFFFFYYCSCV